jgi:hypothetical protein
MFDVPAKFRALQVGTALADAGVAAKAGQKNVTTSARPDRTRKKRGKVTIP